jgi:MoaA/NifB/PqqE/SkfB family radical SAM enzyme
VTAPRTASIVTNLRCNQACVWCTRRSAQDDRAFVRRESVLARIDDAIRSGSREIVLTGGEPSMRVDLIDLVKHARESGAGRVILETNATLVEDDRARQLRAAGLDLARVNVPALDESCDELTRDPGGFSRAVAGMKALGRAGVCIEAAVTLVRSTVDHLAALPRRLRDTLGDGLRALVVGFPVEAADPRELLSFADAAAAVVALERAARPHEVDVRMSTGDPLPPCAFDSHERSRVSRLYAMSGAGPARDGFSHLAACDACRVRDRCAGVANAHVARFGAPAMHPVEDERTRRRLAVVSTVEEQIARELATSQLYPDENGRPQIEETIRVVFRCNQSCTFCFVSTHLPSASPAAIEEAIRAAGKRGAARIALTGGEPTLDPKIVDWVRLARSVSRGTVVLQTNAMRLDDGPLLAQLEEAGLDEAFVSLHGATAEVSEQVTESPATFHRTVAGIDRLHGSRIRVVLNFVVCEKNRHELVDYVRMVASRWPRATVNLSFVGPSTDLVPGDPSLIPRYSDALPAIAEAVVEASRLGLSMVGFQSMCGLPLCLIPPGVQTLRLADVPEGFDQGEFLKTDECGRCSLESKCWGLRRRYAEIHGTGELRAVRP